MARSKKKNISEIIAESLNRLGVGANDSILIGVSGGVDSVVLLHLLHSLQKKQFFKRLGVAHIDHQLRGKDSDRDREFVVVLAKKSRVQLFLHSEDISATAKKMKVGLEEAGREVRYSFFKDCAEHFDFKWIVTAHNADDRIESILMNIVRGTGLKGLRGIPESRKISRKAMIIRPMINCSREMIEQFAISKKISWREDQSNTSSEFTRNRIRASVIPALKKTVPERNIFEVFQRLSVNVDSVLVHINKQVEILEKKAAIKSSKSFFIEENVRSFKSKMLAGSEDIIVREFVLNQIESLTGSPFSTSSEQWQDILQLIKDRKSGSIQLSKTLFVRTSESGIFSIESIPPIKELDSSLQIDIILDTPIGSIQLLKPPKGKISHSKDIAYIRKSIFDANGLLVRNWKPTDRMQPFGMKGTKLVSDILAEAGVKTELAKRRFPIIVLANSPNTVIWVPGIRASELCRISDSAETGLILKRINK